MPGCQAARRCDRPNRPRLNLGPEVPLVSMQGKCYEAGHQQRCAGHNEAYCHSGMSPTMRVSARRPIRAAGNTEISTLLRESCGPSVRRQTARGRKKLQ